MLGQAEVIQVLDAQPTGWLAKHATECLRRSLLDEIGLRDFSCLYHVVVLYRGICGTRAGRDEHGLQQVMKLGRELRQGLHNIVTFPPPRDGMFLEQRPHLLRLPLP